MTMRVKICGLNTADAADAAAHAGADFGGLVFFARSPRAVTIEAGAALAEHLRGRLQIVALVVDESDAMLSRIAETVRPDMFQLHGRETPARVAEIRARFGRPVIKALPVATDDDLSRAADYPMADMLLFDTPVGEGATRPGGHGVAFDWKILKGRSFRQPWFLAGGLTPQNVVRAVEASGAAMVDVSSGVESVPGVKDAGRIAAFVATARQAVPA